MICQGCGDNGGRFEDQPEAAKELRGPNSSWRMARYAWSRHKGSEGAITRIEERSDWDTHRNVADGAQIRACQRRAIQQWSSARNLILALYSLFGERRNLPSLASSSNAQMACHLER